MFAIVGLVLIIIGAVSLINLGLKTWIFTKADDAMCYYGPRYAAPMKEIGTTGQTQEELDRQRAEDERYCKEVTRPAQKQTQAAMAIAQLIVGIPLFGYHWMIIRKENQI
ncbi:MAG: hypothetical protein A3H72_01490 [Candidatus Doudnabacteria bacterium RIFCSPLOWO2_02_FULL_48_8]|uniref:DUF5671 domain-containing protein n=1 Tax=Candidatus Doudnabacteria bacterium RIFCSPHIGHO2_01_FULL_46_24 TaxID=1817825 RepID=A0A1F5NU12_9BACT|nr:MAG: hypothetical protein A2720_01010 [Candidatus Doudnabacteria bacterium RIFCSPHIGHO2_01_FULL_46_24]OGE95421.1 MAG: hypothetical protein A3H72_01490 [Candidatus Doudnabacteria bacterium RIFCSPLOWO2_02_FULL_48_8]OGE95472.1 MAG: hypothetical protein A3E98_01095 [Candidatus Doudnabacteria bacterium RIFCSPHIGHO2_12_FULL_48_11]